MTQPPQMEFIFYALVLILPVSALVARRLPAGSLIKMVLAWLAIFALLFAAVAGYEQWFGKEGGGAERGGGRTTDIAATQAGSGFT